jgi:CMP-N,N'-diacetyllegionaminic acid synthase
MSKTIALIPARSGSKGIPNKNFRKLGNRTLVGHAAHCACDANCDRIVISSDVVCGQEALSTCDVQRLLYLHRPAELATDTSAMYDVVKHAAETLQLANEDVIVLLQPTQPFRTPARVREAVQMLRETGADSVVSVVPLPLTHSPDAVLVLGADGKLEPFAPLWSGLRNRQDNLQVYKRDGTAYAFWVKTLREHTIYGYDVRPLILDPSETCELDTEEQFAEVERRWKERER